jgi:hypothetical protein
MVQQRHLLSAGEDEKRSKFGEASGPCELSLKDRDHN